MTFPERSPHRYALAGMAALTVAMGIGRFVYTPLLPGMMEELHLSASAAGFIASANYAGYLVGAVAAMGRWGGGRERLVVFAALAANAFLAALMGIGTGVAGFAAIRFAAGVASAFVLVFLTAVVFGRLAAAGREDLQAWHFGGVGLGIAISSLMTGALHLAGASWAAGWYWSGALSLAGMLATAALVRNAPFAPAAAAAPEPRLAWNAPLARTVLAYGLFGFGYVITATFLVAIVRQGHGGRLFESAVWLVTGLIGVPSVFFWQRLVPRFGAMAIFAAASVAEAVGVLASVTLGGVAGPLLGGMLLGGTFIALTAIGLQAARRLAAAAARRAIAAMTVAFGLGQILGPIAAGGLADRTGSFLAPSLLAAVALLAAAAVAWRARRDVAAERRAA
jgi:predicted MFS family arabinose efflux permease